jgi:cytochrome d ubiquinol oxidase subunit II
MVRYLINFSRLVGQDADHLMQRETARRCLHQQIAVARIAAISQVTLILVGWCLAQYPNLVTPDLTVSNAHAPEITLRLLVLALGAGAIVLLPSLAFLFHLFKGKDTR